MSAYIFDTETTGLKDPVLIEAAWLQINNPVELTVTKEFCLRYKPTKAIELGALATHHIMDEDLVDCGPSTDFMLPLDADYLIGHNIDYDWKVIGAPAIKRIDVLALCRKLWPEQDQHSQSVMLYLLERTTARDRLRNAHSALEDVKTCYTILGHVLQKLGGVADWEALWKESEAARIPTIMPFGKHKGVAISKVPADYKRWLLGQPDVDPYLIQAFRSPAK